MPAAPENQTPDEVFETFAALRLLFRGVVFAAWAGAAWHLPTGSTAIGALAAVVSGLLLYPAFLTLVPSSIVARNILCRKLGPRLPPSIVMALGIALLCTMLAAAAVLFRLARYMYTPL